MFTTALLPLLASLLGKSSFLIAIVETWERTLEKHSNIQ